MFSQNAQPSFNFFDTTAMPNAFGPQDNVALQFRVEIVALNLQETGTYNDLYARGYKVSMGHDSINEIVSTVARSGMNTRGSIFSSLAPSILDIDSVVSPGDLIQIPNGWGTRRFRFLLQVRETSVQFPDSVFYTYVQGFTEDQDVSIQSQAINPEMRFFINSFFRIQETTMQTAHGPRLNQRVVSSGQVVNGALVVDNISMRPTLYMRPSDVMGKIQTSNDSELKAADIFDVRNTNIAGGNSVINSYQNNTATQYLSRLITPVVDSLKSIGFGPGNGNVIDTAVSNSYGVEPSYTDSPFMTLLTRRFNMIGASGFSMNELASIDPTVGSRTTLRPVAQQWQQGLSARGNSATWDNSLPATILATKLINSIPGFMWQSYMGFVSFSMTNSLTGGTVELSEFRMEPLTRFAPPEYVNAFLTNMQEMVARDISYNGQMIFKVFVNASVLGDVQLGVSINGGSVQNYSGPAFGSGVLNPVFTHSVNNFNNLATNMRSVLDGLQAVYTDSADFSGSTSLNQGI